MLRFNLALRIRRVDQLWNGAAGVNFDGGTLTIRTGAQAANADGAAAGTALATITVPADAMGAAAGTTGNPATATKAGTWADSNNADATGDAGHFRLVDSTATYVIEGSVGALGSGADMELQQATAGLVSGQAFTISGFSYVEPV